MCWDTGRKKGFLASGSPPPREVPDGRGSFTTLLSKVLPKDHKEQESGWGRVYVWQGGGRVGAAAGTRVHPGRIQELLNRSWMCLEARAGAMEMTKGASEARHSFGKPIVPFGSGVRSDIRVGIGSPGLEGPSGSGVSIALGR